MFEGFVVASFEVASLSEVQLARLRPALALTSRSRLARFKAFYHSTHILCADPTSLSVAVGIAFVWTATCGMEYVPPHLILANVASRPSVCAVSQGQHCICHAMQVNESPLSLAICQRSCRHFREDGL